MENNLAIKDMSFGYPEHGAIMDHMIAAIYQYLKGSRCKVMREQKYHWEEDEIETNRFPDISILCDDNRRKALAYIGTPRFIAEVISDSTENIDRNEKMHLYEKIGVEEYWIMDWRKQTVERYLLDDKGEKYILHDIINKDNKESLGILCMPIIKLNFDEIFDLSNY